MADQDTPKMTENELRALCGAEWHNAELFTQEIEEERTDALDYYHSEPYGNEEDGLSQYVTSDVRDTVEWCLPQLIDMFIGGDAPVVFTPDNEEDVKQAQIETAYCQHIFERKNNGFLIAYEAFKTALVQKNAIVKVFWDEVVKEEQETYENQDYLAYETLMNDEEFEIEEITVYYADVEYNEEEFEELLERNPLAVEAIMTGARADVKGVRKSNQSQPRIVGVEPENFFIRRDHNSVDLSECPYSCHRYTKTASELIEEGYDEEMVMDLPALDEGQYDQERTNRFDKEGGSLTQTQTTFDQGRREIEIQEHYLFVDYDGDGKSELRMVRTVGSEVIDNEEVDRIPFHAFTPYINPFKFFGRSMADNVESIQRVSSQLWRDLLNNFTYSTSPRKIISGNVDIDDLLTYVPAGIIRKDANATVENDVTPFVGGEVFPMLQQVENTRAERTGFSRDTVGLNPAALSNSTNLVGSMIMSQNQLLVKMIARIFAETGFKSMMLHIRELMHKHEDKQKLFEMTGKYVAADPRSWRKNRDTEVRTGLGYAGTQEEISVITEMLALQEKIIGAQGGLEGALVGAEHVYNTVARLTKKVGMKDTNSYFRDPATYQAPEPQPTQGDIQLQLTEQQIKMDGMKAEAKNTLDAKKMVMEAEQKEKDRQLEYQKHQDELDLREKMHEQELIYKYGELSAKKLETTKKEMKDEQRQATTSGS